MIRTDQLKVSKEEELIINAIAHRATALMLSQGVTDYTVLQATLDVTVTHCCGNPLWLRELLASAPTHFAHDIGGIRRNLNRHTGKLENYWTPRHSAPKSPYAKDAIQTIPLVTNGTARSFRVKRFGKVLKVYRVEGDVTKDLDEAAQELALLTNTERVEYSI